MRREEKKAEILEATVSPGFVALWMVDSGQWSPRAPTPGHQRPRPGADQINVGLQRGVEVYSTVQYSTVQYSTVQRDESPPAQHSPARQAASDSPPVVSNLDLFTIFGECPYYQLTNAN